MKGLGLGPVDFALLQLCACSFTDFFPLLIQRMADVAVRKRHQRLNL